jgi:simple sugar transport system ATP-binding protein
VSEPILKARGISKYYGHIRAIEHIDFEISPGEVVGLLGDNGAGKSTFIKILSGVVGPTSGELIFEGKQIKFSSPLDARELGIETVYQDLSLASHIDVKSNIFLGREILKKGLLGKVGFLDKNQMSNKAEEMLKSFRATVKSVHQRVEELSGGQRQSVAILRAAAWGSKLIILDEPTAALGVEQSQQVLELIRRLKDKNIAVIFITHTMPFAFEVCDRLVVLRLGKVAANLNREETSIDEVVQYITGSKAEINETVLPLKG